MAETNFPIIHLLKTEPSLTRHPNIHKFYLKSCQSKITSKTPTTAPWLRVLKLLKLETSDYDKSRVLLGALDTHGEVVVKTGDSRDLEHEYSMSSKLQSLKGFVKYICYFECNDNFRTIPSKKHDTLCDGPGSQMKVIVMPYFPLGNIQSYPWETHSIQELHSTLKHAILSMINAFHTFHILHGDFHAGNVLLKKTKQKSISYTIPDIGTFNDIETHSIRPWIMDFENSKVVSMDTPYTKMMAMNEFYFDLNKFFQTLYNGRNKIDPRTVVPITIFCGKLMMKGNMLTKENSIEILTLIDGVRCIQPETES